MARGRRRRKAWSKGMKVTPVHHRREFGLVGWIEGTCNCGSPDCHKTCRALVPDIRYSDSSGLGSSSILVSKSSIEYLMDWSASSSPAWVRVVLASSQKIAAMAFQPRLFPGITRSMSSVTLSVSQMAMTGTPRLPASTIAWVSDVGSATTTNSASR